MKNRQPLDWIRDDVRSSRAYSTAPFDGGVKLDAMESPYALDGDLKKQWLARVSACALNRYPSGQAALPRKLARFFHLPDGFGFLPGNGSDELLQILAMAVAAPGRCVLSPVPGFAMYPVIARNCGLAHVAAPLAPGFHLDLAATLELIDRQQPALVWLAYPNNPTGNLWERDAIHEIIAHAPGMVLIDEAYRAFASDSWLPRIGGFRKLLVMQTFSKLGLAGLRFGMLAGPNELLAELDKIRLPYNVGVLTEASIDFALDHMDHFNAKAALIRDERRSLYRVLQEISGVTPYPSEANFLLLKIDGIAAADVFRGLCRRGVLVRHFPNDPELRDCLRVTVSAPDENRAFIHALRETVGELQRAAAAA